MVLAIVSGVLVVAALALVFLWAPLEVTMKEVQRIFYFHVAVDWVGFLAFFVTLVASVAYLRTHDRKWDIVGMSSVEIGALFLTMGAMTGSLWARPVWNTWWTWDARLTTVAITWLVYLAYLMLRGAIDDPQRRARFSAVYGIIGFVTVPLTFASVFFLRTIHPALFAASSAAQGTMKFDTGLASAKMGMTLAFCVITFTVVYFLLLRMRIRLEQTADRVARLQQELVA
jgi:heme exporter protein C